MRPAVVVRVIGQVLTLTALFMLLSAGVGLLYHDGSASILFISAFVLASFGLFPYFFVPPVRQLQVRETLLIVVGSWVVISVAGALPYLLWGPPFDLVNALFESVSGFTTTGSSILTEVESLPKGLLFWRSATHWIGGTGIIVFALAVLPQLGRVGRSLFKGEFTTLVPPPRLSRAHDIARVILIVYVGLTLLETVALLLAGVNLFEAVTTAFGTIATGGFSPRNESIASYHSLGVEMIVLLFMVLSGMNFAFLYQLTRRGRGATLRESTSVRYYLFFLLLGVVIATGDLHGKIYHTWGEALRYASFQVVSVGTSAGFASADSSIWTPPSMLVLIFFSLICAMAGSTSGGIKLDRLVLFLGLVRRKFILLLHPETVVPLHYDRRVIELSIAEGAMLFITLYLAVVTAATFVQTLIGMPLLEAFTGTIAAMGNVGPGLGSIGSLGNYSAIPGASKLVLAGTMLLGRLEIFSALILFSRVMWRP